MKTCKEKQGLEKRCGTYNAPGALQEPLKLTAQTLCERLKMILIHSIIKTFLPQFLEYLSEAELSSCAGHLPDLGLSVEERESLCHFPATVTLSP